MTDTLYYIDYPLASGSGAITVATVRPETMLGDVAIAVHPEDERYRRLIGEKAILPLVGRKLKIIADDYVKPEFGTGALKITPGLGPQRLRDRAAPRPAGDQRDRRGRPDHRRGARAVRRDDDRRGPGGGRRRAPRAGPDRPHRAVHAHGAVLAPLRRADRAARVAAVVHADGRARPAGDRGRPLPAGCGSTPTPSAGATSTGSRTSARGASRASCGGATRSPSGTAAMRRTSAPTRRRARAGSAIPTCSTRGSRARCGRSRRSAGRRTPPSCARSIRPTSSRRRGTSSSCGSRGW